MGRKARPRVWRDWYVTEAGGQGIHKLCPLSDGYDKAERELARYLDDRDKALQAGLVWTDSPYTVAQLAAEFLQLKEATRKGNTFEFHRKNLVRLVNWYGHLEGRKLTLPQAAEYVARMKKDGLGNTTINHHLRSAKSVLNYAVDAERLVKNPWRKAGLLPEGKRQRVVTEEEFDRLLMACDRCIAYRGKVSREENRQLLRDILCVLRYTAMRPGELRKLRWDHVRWDDDLILIPASEQKTGTTAKDPQDRIIPVLPEGKAILLARREKYGHLDRVFPNIFGEEWTDQLFSQRFARLRKRAGLDAPDHNGEKIVPYSLRHTRLSEAGVKEGWAYPILQRMAGHAPGSRVTSRYVHPDKEDIKRAAREGQQRRLGLAGG